MKSKGKIALIIGLVLLGLIFWLQSNRPAQQPNPTSTSPNQTPAASVATVPPTQLAFEPVTMQVQRDYDQRGKVLLRNDGDKPIAVRVDCQSPSDLYCGFVGRGSSDWYEPGALTLGAGETWAYAFVVHANSAIHHKAMVPVLAMVQDSEGQWVEAARGQVNVQIAPAPLKLKFEWITPDTPIAKARLLKVLRITNEGEDIPDFSLNFSEHVDAQGHPLLNDGALAGRVNVSPVVEQSIFSAGRTMAISIWPRLYPSFIQLTGKLYLHGQGQSVEVPYEAAVPEDQQVYITLSRSTSSASNAGDRCTNKGNTSYSMPASTGSPVPSNGTSAGAGGSFGGGGMLIGNGSAAGDNAPGLSTNASQGEKTNEPDDESAWGSIIGDAGGVQQNDVASKQPTSSDPPVADDDSKSVSPVDESLLENSELLVTDLDDESVIPASATGSDVVPIDERDGVQGRTLDPNWGKKPEDLTIAIPRLPEMLRDAQAASKETVIQGGKDGGVLVAKHNRTENTTALEFQNFGFGIQSGGRKLRAGIPLVRNSYPVSEPTLGKTPGGNTVAAYSRPNDDKQIVTVADVKTGKQIDIGTEGDEPATSPSIARNIKTGKTTLQFVQNGDIKQVELDDNLNVTTPQTVFNSDRKIQRILSTQPLAKGGTATLAKTVDNKLVMKLPSQEEPVVFEGKEGSILAQPDDSVMVALRTADNAIVVKTADGQTYPIAPADPANGPPTLVRTKAGAPRVLFHRNLAEKSEAVTDQGGTFQRDFIKGQWVDLKRTIQPEEPVVAAAIALEFKPEYGKAHYKPMNTQVMLNDKPVGALKERVPDGRYLFRVPTTYLNYQSAGSQTGKPNTISMNIQGIGKGNFHISDQVQIFTKQNLMQEFLVASSHDIAQTIAQESTPEARHHVADVMVTNNVWELPRGLIPGDTFTAEVGLFNTGDVSAPAGQLIAKTDNKIIGKADYKLLPSFDKQQVKINITLPDDVPEDKPLSITVHADVPGDANPADNQITFRALADYTPGLTGPARPLKVAPGALADDVVTTVDISEKPYVFKLSKMSQWYRFKIPDTGKGRLKVELNEADPDIVLGVDLYSPQGQPLNLRDQRWQVSGEWVYLRIGLKPDKTIADAASFTIAWDTTGSMP